ncbi:MAG: secondary thiamine-phosphate synthase enzyme YjbQ [Methanothrix sp.]|uniref:secondary thiamine-phosphate synthase enzyme YjbQ n=1 Tax=Methanothrix sp. TaxID=90426 RepID=UPI0025D1B4FE|nr:secondary thiamine-phosphate synthase enzyme YjbQ [Methanothrix sp.]MCQ8903108.1 secondary thiamine-phosphate synthase enzyme YjbQ [Methanothrix sp.]
MIEIATTRVREVVDITPQVQRAVRESGVVDGICLVYTLHTTTALIVNEAESGLLMDIIDKIKEIVPGVGYKHGENGPAHLQASILGNSVLLPVDNNMPLLGTWQRVLFLELDGPRRRRVGVKVIGSQGAP